MFIPSLGPRSGLGSISSGPTPSTVLTDDPSVFSKVAREPDNAAQQGWAAKNGITSISDPKSFSDPRWSNPAIYPGSDSPDWKWLKGSQFVFIFKDDTLSTGGWFERWFFDDIMKSGWIRSKNFKYYASTPNIISVPDDPWILKLYNSSSIVRALYSTGEVAKPVVTKVTGSLSSIVSGAEGLANIAKYIPYAVGAALILWVLSKRK
jgi:hypothetical protein